MLTHMTMYPAATPCGGGQGPGLGTTGQAMSATAPFVLKEWVPNGHITVEKNPLFYDADNVSLKKVIFYPTDDYGAALQRFRAGELDYQDAPSRRADRLDPPAHARNAAIRCRS